MLNHVTIMGRLCADPELRYTNQGDIPVTSFRIAVERDYAGQGGERETDFYDVTAWRGTAEIICEYFSRGRMIAIDGRLETRSWVDRDKNNRVSVGIVAESVYFADSKREEREEEKPAKGRSTGRSTSKGRTTGRTSSRGRKAA
ncbi:MAG: single-stranded DNA-binding protein [Oscillibacter sp.]|nr:single-stranded DNA-binding protein [Oscillibacter sp.]